ncbi:MAG: CBS domain-containing protein [Gammaproteobacteria bacterium]
MNTTPNGRTVVRVKDVMKPEVLLLDGKETVRQAIDLMRAKDARCLVVRKRSPDDEYGIVLLGDIAKQVIARDRSPDRVNVYEIMAKPVISVHSNMDIRYAARLFQRFGLSQCPVIDGDTIVGLLTYSGIVLEGLVDRSG